MGFLNIGKKEEVLEVYRIPENFVSNVINGITSIAKGETSVEKLTKDKAQKALDCGFCSEKFLSTLSECIVNHRLKSKEAPISSEEEISIEFIKTCNRRSIGEDYLFNLVYRDGSICGRAVLACLDAYEAAVEEYNTIANSRILSKDRANKENIEVTPEVIECMREKLISSDSLSDNMLKFIWEKMPGSLKKGNDPIDCILDYIGSL